MDTALEREPEFPLTPYGEALGKAAEKLSGRPRHAALNAIRGLKRAWRIAPIDPEMAFFRAVTAEEEAATALMAALKHRQYPNASQLNFRKHTHKAGVYPFVRAIESLLAESLFPIPTVTLSYDADTPRIDIGIPSEKLGLPAGHLITPDEPLNALIRSGPPDAPRQNLVDFQDQLRAIAGGHGATDIASFIEAEANLRNKLLYASDIGWTVVENVDAGLVERRRRVLVLIGLTIAIMQTSTHQLLAVQALQAYLGALDKLPKDPVDFDSAQGPEPDRQLLITRKLGEGPVAELRIRETSQPSPELNFLLHPTQAVGERGALWIRLGKGGMGVETSIMRHRLLFWTGFASQCLAVLGFFGILPAGLVFIRYWHVERLQNYILLLLPVSYILLFGFAVLVWKIREPRKRHELEGLSSYKQGVRAAAYGLFVSGGFG